MTTTFDAEFAIAPVDDLLALHGQSVTYTASGEDAASITAIFDEDATEPDAYDDSRQIVRTGTLSAKPADVPSPTLKKDKFTIGGTTWVLVGLGTRTPLVECRIEARAKTGIGKGHEVVR